MNHKKKGLERSSVCQYVIWFCNCLEEYCCEIHKNIVPVLFYDSLGQVPGVWYLCDNEVNWIFLKIEANW